MKLEECDARQALLDLAEAIAAARKKQEAIERPVPTFEVKTADGRVVYRTNLN